VRGVVYAFLDFELDEPAFQLHRKGEPVALEPKVLELLLHLVRRRGELVTKAEILASVWPGVFVSESVLPTNVRILRKALGGDRGATGAIQTVYGRGYRFVAPVVERVRASEATTVVPEGRPPTDPPFVGRRDALADLAASLDEARASRPSVRLVVGEPGIGKTRVLEELARLGQRAGFRVLSARCHDGGATPPLWPWLQLLRQVIADANEVDVQTLVGAEAPLIAALLPELAARFPGLVLERPMDSSAPLGAAASFRLFDALVGVISRAWRSAPLLLLIDDLHAADPSSLEFLVFLVRELRHAPVALVSSYRGGGLRRGHPLARATAEIRREPHCGRIALRGLESEESAQLVEGMTMRALRPELLRDLHERSDGNPFFLCELVRWLVEDHALDAERPTGLPEGVREAIGRRLDTLSAECNYALSLASVIGREFDVPVLCGAAGVPEKELLTALDEALQAQVLVADGSLRMRFHHALVRETLYDELPLSRRVAMHQRVADVLESLGGDDLDGRAAALAHHYFHAAVASESAARKAVASARTAARRALEVCAYEEGAALLLRVLQLLELRTPEDESLRCELLLELGDAEARAGRRQLAREAFERAAELARRAARPDLLVRSAVGFGQRSEFGAPPDERLGALLEEALDATPEGDAAMRARLLSRLAGTLPHTSDPSRVAELASEALRLAEASGDREALAQAHIAHAWALGFDQVDEQDKAGGVLVELGVRRVREGSRLSGLELELCGREVRYLSRLAKFDSRGADRELAEIDRIVGVLHEPAQRWIRSWHHLGRALAEARFADADCWIAEATQLGAIAGIPGSESLPVVLRAASFCERGADAGSADWEEARGVAALIEAAGRAYPFLWNLRILVAALHLELDRAEEARAAFEEFAAAGFETLPRDVHWPVAMAQLAALCSSLDDRRRAGSLYALLAPYASRNLVHNSLRVYVGSASHFLGLLAELEGRHDKAVELLEVALAANLAMGSRAHAARTRGELGRCLARSRDPSKASRGRELLHLAQEEAKALGMAGLLRQTSASGRERRDS